LVDAGLLNAGLLGFGMKSGIDGVSIGRSGFVGDGLLGPELLGHGLLCHGLLGFWIKSGDEGVLTGFESVGTAILGSRLLDSTRLLGFRKNPGVSTGSLLAVAQSEMKNL
jgi:hypothetical protein